MNSSIEKMPLVEIFSARPSRLNLAREGLIKAGIKNDNNYKVLEVGCSFGDVCLNFVNEFKCNFVGVDIEGKSIDIAKKKLMDCAQANRVSFFKGNVYDLPFERNSFDLVLSEAAFSLLEDKDRAVEEYFRVLKSSGRVIINDFNIRGNVEQEVQEKMTIPCFKSMKPVDEYIKIFNKHGFSLISYQDVSKEVFRIAMHLKKACKYEYGDLNSILAESNENRSSGLSDFKTFFNCAKMGYVQLIFESNKKVIDKD